MDRWVDRDNKKKMNQKDIKKFSEKDKQAKQIEEKGKIKQIIMIMNKRKGNMVCTITVR